MAFNKPHWINRNILALGVVSFLSDLGHEMAIPLLPAFLISLGGSAAVLGLMEGIANATLSFMKLSAGILSDRTHKRTPFLSIGYSIATISVAALASVTSTAQLLFWHAGSRLGKGIREPARDALLADSAHTDDYGKIFGFHRMMDTLGSIGGPLLAYTLMMSMSVRAIFLIAAMPLALAVFIIYTSVRDPKSVATHIMPSVGLTLPSFSRNYKLFLTATTIFNLGFFANTLLILRATELLKTNGLHAAHAAGLGILLYALQNILYAASAIPAGFIADRCGEKLVLIIGFCITATVSLGLMYPSSALAYLAIIFILSGMGMSIIDTLKQAFTAQLVPEQVRATSFGLLAGLEGITGLLSSAIMGFLWTAFSPVVGFGYSALLCVLGALILTQVETPCNHAR